MYHYVVANLMWVMAKSNRIAKNLGKNHYFCIVKNRIVHNESYTVFDFTLKHD